MTPRAAALLIMERCPALTRDAEGLLRAIHAGSPMVAQRCERLVAAALADPQAFTADERAALAAAVPEPTGESEALSELVQVRLTPADARALRGRAASAGVSLSEYVRGLVLADAEQDGE